MTVAGQDAENKGPNLTGAVDEAALVSALLEGSEAAFVLLLDRYNSALLRLAMVYVHNKAVAEDVVQETWVGMLNGLRNFEKRSSLKTWLFRILTNQAKTRARREARSLPFSDFTTDEDQDDDTGRDLSRFLPNDAPQWAGHWSSIPRSWEAVPEAHLLSQETQQQISKAIDALTPAQRQVITLRDVEGWPSEEVSNILGITDTNQRVLLHRARTKVRSALEDYLNPA